MNYKFKMGRVFRGVAQPGSAHVWGACGRRFKSSRPDQKILEKSENLTTLLFKPTNQKMLGAPPGHQIAATQKFKLTEFCGFTGV